MKICPTVIGSCIPLPALVPLWQRVMCFLIQSEIGVMDTQKNNGHSVSPCMMTCFIWSGVLLTYFYPWYPQYLTVCLDTEDTLSKPMIFAGFSLSSIRCLTIPENFALFLSDYGAPLPLIDPNLARFCSMSLHWQKFPAVLFFYSLASVSSVRNDYVTSVSGEYQLCKIRSSKSQTLHNSELDI